MLIRSRMGVSADGFVSTPDGVPTLAIMPGFVPGVSHGFPEFIDGCDAVVMGRNTFVPALGAPNWPWPGLQVFVLTSRPLPESTPGDVIAVADGPAALAERLRGAEHRQAGGVPRPPSAERGGDEVDDEQAPVGRGDLHPSAGVVVVGRDGDGGVA